MKVLKESCYKEDIDMPTLARHLQMFKDVVEQSSPEVKKVTSIQTICDAMNKEDIFKNICQQCINSFVYILQFRLHLQLLKGHSPH